jgi:hypothetical protein
MLDSLADALGISQYSDIAYMCVGTVTLCILLFFTTPRLAELGGKRFGRVLGALYTLSGVVVAIFAVLQAKWYEHDGTVFGLELIAAHISAGLLPLAGVMVARWIMYKARAFRKRRQHKRRKQWPAAEKRMIGS